MNRLRPDDRAIAAAGGAPGVGEGFAVAGLAPFKHDRVVHQVGPRIVRAASCGVLPVRIELAWTDGRYGASIEGETDLMGANRGYTPIVRIKYGRTAVDSFNHRIRWLAR